MSATLQNTRPHLRGTADADAFQAKLPTLIEALTDALRKEIPTATGAAPSGVERAVLAALSRVITTGPQDRGSARQRLAEALTALPALPLSAVAELASRADWPLPETVQAVAVLPQRGAPQCVPDGSDGRDVLVGSTPEGMFLLVPDPDEQTDERLRHVLRGRTAVLGPPVPCAEAGSSLRWARGLLDLLPPPSGPGTRLVQVTDHLSTLLLLQDPCLARLFASRWLRPLAELTERQSERVVETLFAWLEGGGTQETAKRLRIHPQTVRYRMRQIEKLYGSALRDPHSRFELQLALRSERLAAEVRRGRARAIRRMMLGEVAVPAAGSHRHARINGL